MNDNKISDLAIIIPVAPGETLWKNLLEDLKSISNECDILLSSPERPEDLIETERVRWVRSNPGRAEQLNAGALETDKHFLWFLHADSRLPPESVSAINRALLFDPLTIHYFDLRFYDGSKLMRLTEWGTKIRSHYFQIPFGDQGFLLSRDIFEELGGFVETPLGEDHLFIWQARAKNIGVRSMRRTLFTSARKYSTRGWLKTTASHLNITFLQAFPLWWRYYRKMLWAHSQ